MAAQTVLITKLVGQAWIRGADGNLTAIREGMRIPADAEVVTATGSSVQLQADGTPPLTVGENQDVRLTADLVQPPQPEEAAVASPGNAQIDQIIASINSGADPFDQLDPTAATLAGGGGGGGSFVRLTSVLEATSPLDLAYPGLATPPVESVQLGGVAATAPATTPEPTPVPGVAAVQGVASSVSEKGLTSVEDTSETAKGSVTVRATDGIKDVTIGGETHTIGDWVGKSITTADGSTLTVTGATTHADGSVTLDYSYTLNSAQTHDKATHDQEITDVITVTVHGVGGSSGSGNIVVTIVDDVPVATSINAGSLTEDG
ncbi:retention module-containing protein, partial [Comamonas guangdongensis]